MNIDYKLIGKRIQTCRKAKSITQEQLAEKLDVTVGYISQLERGITKINLDTLAKISTVIEVELPHLLSDSTVHQNTYLSGELFEKFQRMSPNQKKLLLNICDNILEYTN